MKQAGWRTRQHSIINNRGKLTDTMMFKSIESNAFHVRQTMKEMGQQSVVTFETIVEHDVALAFYVDLTQQALVESVNPPDPDRVGYTILEEDDGEVVVTQEGTEYDPTRRDEL